MTLDIFFANLGFIVVALILIFSVIKIAREYERAVIFRLGRLIGIRGPGLFLIIPIIERMVKLDLRVITLDVPEQDVITKDNIPVKVDAVLYFKISDPARAIVEVENYMLATSQIAQTSLRDVVGSSNLDELLAEREKINRHLHQVIDKATDPWGIKVTGVEVKHVEIPEAMQRAIAKQAEAERMRRAKIILAEGEYQAAQKLKAAGDILGARPVLLRYLETLTEAAKERNTTIIFPAEMLEMFKNKEKPS
jgi:regulator of protease activity HflC (stomatin/prohibitin superfamily)